MIELEKNGEQQSKHSGSVSELSGLVMCKTKGGYKKEVEDALGEIMCAAGSPLIHYMPHTREAMSKAMLEVMKKSYIEGSNATYAALRSAKST